jgi:hypothetical protein
MEKITNQELAKELNLLKLEEKKSNKQIESAKNSFIKDIKGFDKETVSNNIFTEKKYTIWERIKVILGMS